MPSKRVPKYRLHRTSGRAIVTLPSPARGLRGRDVFLGPYGSAQSRAEYARVLAEWNVAGATLSRAGNSPTIVELCVAYTEHAMKYYQKDGEPTSQVAAVIAALKFVQQLYGRMPAVEFGPRFFDWQLSQDPAESWRECELHARNLLGAEGYHALLLEIENRRSDTTLSPTGGAPLNCSVEWHSGCCVECA